MVSGWKTPIPIISKDLVKGFAEEEITLTVWTGDQDGANLPWFDYADATLLFWWIQRDTMRHVPATIYRSQEEGGIYNLEVRLSGSDPLLSIKMTGKDIVANVPVHSSSPSSTYQIRIIILHIVAPVAVLVAGVTALTFYTFGNSFIILFAVAMYGFLIVAIIASLWRCLGGPSLEDSIDFVHDRLDMWRENERLRVLPLEFFQDRLVRVYSNQRVRAFLYVCQNGWHPEREAARAEAAQEEEPDVEKGDLIQI